ncbi:hypothetical protein [Kosakonia sp. S42]|uniref:hypothetical protein n=1 Tax=Kosakonia sp. S42 TaxID=2767458 RepID=UPI00190AAE90|nr:hypothetical protein [Kosakonia sp. S42]
MNWTFSSWRTDKNELSTGERITPQPSPWDDCFGFTQGVNTKPVWFGQLTVDMTFAAHSLVILISNLIRFLSTPSLRYLMILIEHHSLLGRNNHLLFNLNESLPNTLINGLSSLETNYVKIRLITLDQSYHGIINDLKYENEPCTIRSENLTLLAASRFAGTAQICAFRLDDSTLKSCSPQVRCS